MMKTNQFCQLDSQLKQHKQPYKLNTVHPKPKWTTQHFDPVVINLPGHSISPISMCSNGFKGWILK